MITIEKASEILTQQVRYYHQIHQVDIIDALKLGIEALKRIKDCRHDWNLTITEILPGETREPPK